MSTQVACPSCQTKLSVPATALGKQIRCPKCSTAFKTRASESQPPTKTTAARKPAAKSPAGKRTITCPACSQKMAVAASAAGKTIQCPKCQKRLQVPGGTKPAAPAPTATSTDTSGGMDWGGLDQTSGFPSAPAAPTGGEDVFGGSYTPPAANPYAAPAAMSQPNQAKRKRSGQGDRSVFYIINGVILAIWGGLSLLGSLARAVQMAISLATLELPPGVQLNYPRLTGMFAGLLIGFAIGAVFMSGGIAMIRRKGLSSARTAAVLGAIPCCGLLIFPFGIWACVLVFADRAKRDFGETY